MIIKIKALACVVIGFLLSSVAEAATHLMMNVTAGGDRPNVGTTTNILFIPPFYNTYTSSNNYDSELFGGIFLGAETDFHANWQWQYGVSYYQNSAFQAHGVVNQFGDPAFANLTYAYQIQSRRYLVETKILYIFKKIFHPYVNFALGESANKSYNYTEQPITSDAVPMAQLFGNKTTHNLTYFAGLGIDMDILSHMRLGGGYRYVNLGKAELNTSPLQQDTTTINKIIRASEFFIQLSLIK